MYRDIYENIEEFMALQEELFVEEANWAFCCMVIENLETNYL